MISAVLAMGVSMLVAVLLTPIVRRFAIEVGAIDHPGARRVHIAPVPRLGGLAMVAGFFTSLLALFVLQSDVGKLFFAQPMRALGFALGGLLVCGVGIIDDVRGVRAWHKLWVQIAAAIIAYVCGFRIDGIALPFLGSFDMGVFGIFVTVLWIVAIINAINLIDGLDGLAGGVTFFACVTHFVVAAIGGDPIVMLVSASLGGAVLGFLLFNFNPASIFMGDSGSLFLGYILATTSIMGASTKSSTTVALLAPLVALGLPIMDTLFAMLRRFLERRPIFSADRGHIHHRLLALGFTHRRAVLTLYGLCIVFTTGAIIVSIGRNWQIGAALVMLSLTVFGLLRAMGNFQLALRRLQHKQEERAAHVERLRIVVPSVLSRISAAYEPRELSAILTDFAEQAKLQGLVLSTPQSSGLQSMRWSAAPAEDDHATQSAFITATYELPSIGPSAKLEVSWPSEIGEIGLDADILLQLVVDACDARNARGLATDTRRAIATTERLRSN